MGTIAKLIHSGTLAPNAVLPVQLQYRAPIRAEERLMLAILEDAVLCFRRGAFTDDRHTRRLFTEACDWIYCDDRNWPFSFENVCEMLGIAPAYLRSGLDHWRHFTPSRVNRGAGSSRGTRCGGRSVDTR